MGVFLKKGLIVQQWTAPMFCLQAHAIQNQGPVGFSAFSSLILYLVMTGNIDSGSLDYLRQTNRRIYDLKRSQNRLSGESQHLVLQLQMNQNENEVSSTLKLKIHRCKDLLGMLGQFPGIWTPHWNLQWLAICKVVPVDQAAHLIFQRTLCRGSSYAIDLEDA